MSEASRTISPPSPISLERIPTGIPGLDTVLDGGIPRYSLNIIAGPPGAGKAHDWRLRA